MYFIDEIIDFINKNVDSWVLATLILLWVILIFLFLFPQFSGIKENKILIKYNISPRLFILFILIVTILMHYTLGF